MGQSLRILYASASLRAVHLARYASRGEWGLFGLPLWLQDLSPFRQSSAMPVEPFDQAGALAMAAIAVALGGLAAYCIQRRDLTA
jgi:ABC-2 type transport system permease protein